MFVILVVTTTVLITIAAMTIVISTSFITTMHSSNSVKHSTMVATAIVLCTIVALKILPL